TASLSSHEDIDCRTRCLVNCSEGHYFMSGNCLECPVGFFCPGGQMAPQWCPMGTYNQLTAQTDITSCQACPYGYISLETRAGCRACPDGYWCDPQKGLQRHCNPGQYSPEGVMECWVCPKGYICPNGQETQRCLGGHEPNPTLSLGFFQGIIVLMVALFSHYCVLLVLGLPLQDRLNAKNAADVLAVQMAQMRHILPRDPLALLQDCKAISVRQVNLFIFCYWMEYMQDIDCHLLFHLLGHFQSNGLTMLPCPGGSFESRERFARPTNGSLSYFPGVKQCLKCPAGYFCPNGTSYPNPCPPGTYNPLQGQDESSDCRTCPAGRACTQAGLAKPDSECMPGYVCPVGSSSPHAPSNACPPGTFSNRSDLFDKSQCETCPERFVCTRGSGGKQKPPSPCPAGHYCPPGTKNPTQYKCAAGTWSNNSGLAAQNECILCPAGWFCMAGAHAPSGSCSAGHFCPEGKEKPAKLNSWLYICTLLNFFECILLSL
ncbi:hypothetical protein JD844_031442, partial [Phrynosoma platyrhinos]